MCIAVVCAFVLFFFFFKQKTAYEIMPSLVGSEMCIRDRVSTQSTWGATLLIFCNKQDIKGSLTSEEIKDFLQLDEMSTRHWGIMPCSAVTGDGLIEGIDWIVNDIASRIFMLN
eukprot:TRINITY_DN3260_c0_g1_i1.p3 TRINITY_DN3260_c0_g1~~TRINITY_DN3260_c0_g1_i1.p3  ORF type:complete len:114 (+),score=29.30 TRINITY_DN3260_c0_g1_i1:45-386(+)